MGDLCLYRLVIIKKIVVEWIAEFGKIFL